MKLLWDLDGTIFDTYPAILDSFIAVHEAAHGEPADRTEALRWLKKNSQLAFQHYGISEDFRPLFKELDHKQSEAGSPPFDGIENILAAAEVNVIVTHRTKASTIELLNKWGLIQYFDEIVSPEDDGFPRKPDAAAYQYLHQKYNLDWAIGDRSLDLIPARTAGLKTVSFQNEDIEADVYIEAYDESFFEKMK
ncbi:HAD hydrolase-like protein [Domibacillus epiphyticus]|uniref:Haloacid dehalogenase n=1 Tax=Domibacillus epiphyticus TaxID=1714355 RepID=A0A1V2A534_9BACI|nr:HAD hydrolase-like protein [Domibacillus epiphyticus]OMP66129.1 haloacid dehalogenase [Domibacillus epiphyticus]